MADSPAEQDPEATTLGEHAASMADPASARAALDRGRFLSGVTVGVGGLMSAVIAAPALGFVLAPVVRDGAALRRRPRADEPVPGRQVEPLPRRDVHAQAERRRHRAPRGVHPQRRRATSSRRSRTPACTSAARCGRSARPASAAPAMVASTTPRAAASPGRPVRPLNRYDTKVEKGRLLLGALLRHGRRAPQAGS